MVLTLVAWSGNLYGLLGPAFALTWWLSVRERTRRSEWLVGANHRRRDGLSSWDPRCCWCGCWPGAAPTRSPARWSRGSPRWSRAIWLGGTGIFREYLDVILHSAGTPAPLSIPGLLVGLGLSPAVARLGLLAVVGVGCLAVVLLRRDSRRSFAVAIVVSLFATTVVRPETLVVALVALVPWATHANMPTSSPQDTGARAPMLAIAAGVTAIAVAISIATGGLRSSSMTMVNETGQAVVVRFTVPSQDATFGFRLDPGEAGTGWLDRIGTVSSLVFVTTAKLRPALPLRGRPGRDRAPRRDDGGIPRRATAGRLPGLRPRLRRGRRARRCRREVATCTRTFSGLSAGTVVQDCAGERRGGGPNRTDRGRDHPCAQRGRQDRPRPRQDAHRWALRGDRRR